MPRDTLGHAPSAANPGSAEGARIGPNAILQYLPVLDDALGRTGRDALMRRADVTVPSGDAMIPQDPAAALHRHVRTELGALAPGLAARAGKRTGDYILQHRIPPVAQAVLRVLPPRPAARLLSQAIARHAWTFVGSGRLEVENPFVFLLRDNPVIAGEASAHPLCAWHAAVFETLYRRLVHPALRCRETTCAACGDGGCRFSLSF